MRDLGIYDTSGGIYSPKERQLTTFTDNNTFYTYLLLLLKNALRQDCIYLLFMQRYNETIW